MKYTFRQKAHEIHESVNHTYDGKPYSYHLQMVVNWAAEFIELIPEEDRADVYAACWLHDVIEYCRMTYNDVVSISNI